MQICSNIDYLPYNFSKEFPFVDWGEKLYSPPVEMGRLHRHNCLEIGCCFQGSGVFLVEDEILPFGAKDCSIIFPGQKHIASSNRADPSWWHFVMIDTGLLLKVIGQEASAGLSRMKDHRPDVPNLINTKTYPHLCMIIQLIVEQLAKFAGVPVWNGLTNEFHPTQILADFLTIQEHFGTLQGKKLVYMGDARYNMGNSLMVGCAKMGMHFVACAPQTYFPDAALIETCQKIAAGTGATLEFDTDPMHAVQNADVIYTDVWVSMGEPDEVWQTRIHDLLPYQVNAKLMAQAGPQCRFMHCLPAFHDLGTTIGKQISEKYGLTAMEVTDEVFESPQSIVFDEAENRMHTIKAVMAATLA